MRQIVIIGCGIIGAAIAYEMSLNPELQITVIEKNSPAQGATKAALGVLMAIISNKKKGRAWKIRQMTISRYDSLIAELEELLNRQIPFNRQGILLVTTPTDEMANWQKFVKHRQENGFPVEMWSLEQVREYCPQIALNQITAGIYSPQDRQVDPIALAEALIDASQMNGVKYYWHSQIDHYDTSLKADQSQVTAVNITTCNGDEYSSITLPADHLIVAAGLESLEAIAPIFPAEEQNWLLAPVLGQVLTVNLGQAMGNPEFQPVITGEDILIVPLVKPDLPVTEYGIGATVEFPDALNMVEPQPHLLVEMHQRAIEFCPPLATGTITNSWSGLRPYPAGKSAPIIEKLTGWQNIILATGHYRNGVLMAPATALMVKEMIKISDS